MRLRTPFLSLVAMCSLCLAYTTVRASSCWLINSQGAPQHAEVINSYAYVYASGDCSLDEFCEASIEKAFYAFGGPCWGLDLTDIADIGFYGDDADGFVGYSEVWINGGWLVCDTYAYQLCNGSSALVQDECPNNCY